MSEGTLDYSSTRLAQEDFIPHAAVVKKLKKYAGQNYSKATGGKIFRTNPLKVLQYARAQVDGVNQTIYKFNKADHDECARLEFVRLAFVSVVPLRDVRKKYISLRLVPLKSAPFRLV